MQPPLRIRPAVAGDLDLVLTLMREYYAFDHLTFDDHVARAAKTLLAEPAHGRMVIAEVEGQPAGYLVLTYAFSLEFHGRVAWIDELYLRADARGRGFGKEIVEWAADACRRDGVDALRLEVEHANTAARALYERHGFRAHPRAIMTRWL